MGKRVVRNGFLELAGVDWSAFCTGVTVTLGGSPVVINTFGGAAVAREAGLLDDGFSCQMVMPDDGSYEAQFKTLRGTKITVKVRADSVAAIGAGNPQYEGTAVFMGWDFGGNVGEASTFTLDLPADGEITLNITP